MSDSNFEKYKSYRTDSFKNDENLTALLKTLSKHLKPIQQEIEGELKQPQFPLGLIVGCPRSGTTLLSQWFASMPAFAYPSNLMARFAYAPYIGGLIQNMLFNPNYDEHGDFKDIQSNLNFNSDLGKSKGALATNEFHHFFRNYMPNFDPQYLSEEQLNKVDFKGLISGVASIEKAFNKPFVMKGMMLQYNILDLFERLENVLFIHIKRNPLLNMQSIYRARIKYYNDAQLWWSVKPKEYERLKNMDVYHQIAGQVFYTTKSIEMATSQLPVENSIVIDYEDFCVNPEFIFNSIIDKYEKLNCRLVSEYQGEASFSTSKTIHLSEIDCEKFMNAYKKIESDEV